MRDRIKTAVVLTMIISLMMTFGCVSSRSGRVYSREDARQVHMVDYGVVDAVKPVMIEGARSGFGKVAGAIIGGILGSALGSGAGRKMATVIGAAAGGAAGSAMEEDATRSNGLEIEVSLDSGETLVIVQEADIDVRPGDRVKVLTARDGSARVSF